MNYVFVLMVYKHKRFIYTLDHLDHSWLCELFFVFFFIYFTDNLSFFHFSLPLYLSDSHISPHLLFPLHGTCWPIQQLIVHFSNSIKNGKCVVFLQWCCWNGLRIAKNGNFGCTTDFVWFLRSLCQVWTESDIIIAKNSPPLIWNRLFHTHKKSNMVTYW